MKSIPRAPGRSALIAAVLIGIGPVLAASSAHASDSPAATSQVPMPGHATQVLVPSQPQCFGEPATIVMTTAGSQLGTSGNDVIIGTSGDDFIDSLGGQDLICAGDGIDRISADFDPGTGIWDPQIIVVWGVGRR